MDIVLLMEKPNIIWINSNIINDRINSNHYKGKMLTNIDNILKSELDIFKIKDIVELNQRGKGLSIIKDGKTPNYKVRNLTNWGIDKEPDYISENDYLKNPSCHIKKGDVLLASTGVGSLGKVDLFYSNLPATADGHITILRTKNKYDGGYLKSYLQCKYGQILIEQNTLGSTGQTELYSKDIEYFPIPIPSPEIQKYIGDKVRKAEELREEAKKIKSLYQELISDIYGDSNTSRFPKGIYYVQSNDLDNKNLRIDSNYYNPLYNNENIKCNKMIELSKLVKFKNNTKVNLEEKYIYFEIRDISTSNVLEEKERITGSELPGRAKLKLRKGDIIISLIQESIQVTSYVDVEFENALTTNGCAVLVSKNKSIPAYLYAIMSSEYFISQKCKYLSGTNIRSIAKDDLLSMSIPIIEQNMIDNIVELVNEEFMKIRKSKQLIQYAKQDVEDLIEGNFDMSEIEINNN